MLWIVPIWRFGIKIAHVVLVFHAQQFKSPFGFGFGLWSPDLP